MSRKKRRPSMKERRETEADVLMWLGLCVMVAVVILVVIDGLGLISLF